MVKRLAVLASGSGSNLQALLDTPDLGGDVVLVATDRADAGALARAHDAGIASRCVPLEPDADRAVWADTVATVVAGAAPDLVVLAGFMRMLPGRFIDRWPTMNVHPSLLPAFPGPHAVKAALEWGVKVTGATVHFVDERVDHGPIVTQGTVDVAADDDARTLHARIQHVEHQLLPDAVRAFCAGRLRVEGRRVSVVP